MNTLHIKGYDIPVYVKDNNSNKTLLCIHGFHSSHEFIGDITKLNNNFNIVSISFPGSKFLKPEGSISTKLFTEITEEVLKHIKSSKVYVLGHSLGGIMSSSVSVSGRVKKVFYLSTIHPLIGDTPLHKALKTVVAPSSVRGQVLSKVLSGSIAMLKKITDTSLHKFIDVNNPWFEISKNDLMDVELIKHTLRDNYTKTKDKAVFICGSEDKVISDKHFHMFVEGELEKEVIVVDNAQHSPCLDQPNAMNEILNSHIEFKKRFLPKLRKIIKI